MFSSEKTANPESISAPHLGLAQQLAAAVPALLIFAGLIARLISAHSKFLNADEAMHYLLAMQPTIGDTYRATLGTAHPPLLIIFLHYWAMILHSEFFLRLPSVLAGTAAGWFLYAWLRGATGRATALVALSLVLFSPALIYTSAEVRQYALLLCLMSATLYFLERAFGENSPRLMIASAMALYLALFTHYAALIFAASIAVYGVLRIAATRPEGPLFSVWIAAQAGCLAIAAFLWKTHIAVIRHRSLTHDVAESYLRSSLFHPGQENVFLFLARANLRLFHFLFSEGAISVLGMLLCVAGIVLLLQRGNTGSEGGQPSSRQLGTLLLLPFVLNCAAALIGVYPYGGTRHNSYLALFAMPAIAIAITRWRPSRKWATPLAIAIALVICNFTVTPAGSYINPRNQKKELMDQAAGYLGASVPDGSIVLTDYESGLLLSYYLCHADITHSGEPKSFFYRSPCGNYNAASLLPRLWVFRADTFPQQMQELAKSEPALMRAHEVWLFQAGFIVDREPEFQSLLAQYGCSSPRKFGPNILVCRIGLPVLAEGQ
ncbi:MAG: putative rane protein [Acidobacteriaceae bacterium]|nr:putative rane protein [Acidobacteriaceae bacterium]